MVWGLLGSLVPAPPDGAISPDDVRPWLALYAGMAIQESALWEPEQQFEHYKENVRLWLREVVARGLLDPMDRAEAGRILSVLGDDRPGVGLRDDGLPDIVWCEAPGGEVQIEDKTFKVEPFYIARYPVTYKQFRAFIDAEDGIQDDRWWKGLAKTEKRDYGQQWPYDNHPRETVTWYQAAAFCRWLSAKLDYEIALPAEWQWQQAATGGNPANKYPWGPEWEDDHANSEEAGIGQTSAVGMFPAGASPAGVMDMAGNVWEWCANDYYELEVVPNPSTDTWMALRGGSYLDRAPGCGSRYNLRPDFHWFALLGFRLLCVRPHL
jgi:formylglycine-generating enzyme required for sulfatase activity